MAAMDIGFEIHVPGLDMSKERWNNHVIFMEEIHTHFRRIAVEAYRCFLEDGRGTMFVSKGQWMTIIRRRWSDNQPLFPFHYFRENEMPETVDFGVLGDGFTQMLREYDPERHVVLTVEHHPGELLSSYLLVSDPGPRAVYEANRE